MKASLAAIIGFLSFGYDAFSQDYVGAEAVLKKATASSEKAGTSAPISDTPVKLKHDLKEFQNKAKTLPPAQAAKEWLQFVDRFLILPADRDAASFYMPEDGDPDSNQIGFRQVAEALPPPPSWEVLTRALESRAANKNDASNNGVLTAAANWLMGNDSALKRDAEKNAVLKAMAHWLVGNGSALKKDIDELDGLPKEQTSSYLDELQWGIMQNSDDGEATLAALQQRLQKGVKGEFAIGLQIPDLISLVGDEKATAFLRDALRNGKGRLSIKGGVATEKLARKLALEMVNELKVPQWGLANSLDSVALYEAMAKRFAGTDRDRYERSRAQSYYLLGLIAGRRTPEAAAFVANHASAGATLVNGGAVAAMERAGYTVELADFFHDVLEKNPDLPFWHEYVALAAKALETDKMLALAEASAARQGLTPRQRRSILDQLHRAYLAADNVDKALEIIRQEIALEKSDTETTKDPEGVFSSSEEEDDPGLALARMGEVLGRIDWVDEGIRAVREANARPGNARDREKRARNLNSLAGELIELKRGPEAEQVLTEALLAAPVRTRENFFTPTEPRTLALLLNLYHRAGRPDDVFTLLTRAPKWHARDLAKIFSKSVWNGRDKDYVGFFAAEALLQKGRAAEAAKIINTLLDQHGEYDPAYEYLIKLEGANAVSRLDQLFSHDQFEERPLIWKAKLLFEAGKLEEAEKCARQAIAIDPSDGEQGPGRRMLVYSVLADIREKRGDAKEAETFRGAVTAIRHSEEADRFYGAGLLKRAVGMYKESLSHFTDAYCIQSRLALRLAELGDGAGADEHYRRAYELMPDSFGRVESHCFGCERAFDGKRAQSIAERVFTEVAAKRPEKPQVHYLLGYLRMAEERYAEALPEFKEAVKLDPEYLNAWKKLGELSEKIHLPAKDREATQWTTLRLDPAGHHSSFRINDVIDLRATWKALDAAESVTAKAPETLLPLTASSNEMRKAGQTKGSESMYGSFIDDDSTGNPRLGAGHVFAQHQVLEAVIHWFDYGLRSK